MGKKEVNPVVEQQGTLQITSALVERKVDLRECPPTSLVEYKQDLFLVVDLPVDEQSRVTLYNCVTGKLEKIHTNTEIHLLKGELTVR